MSSPPARAATAAALGRAAAGRQIPAPVFPPRPGVPASAGASRSIAFPHATRLRCSGGGGVESFQPFLFQPREKGGAGHVVRELAEIHGGGFHGEGEAAEQPHDFARRVAFRLAAETSVGLVALDEREGVVRRQFVNGQERAVAVRAVQFVFAQPRGGEDVQPVAAVEPRDLRGVEQAGPVHVVEEEQAAVRRAGVGEFLQLAAGALELEVGVFLFVVGELEADGRGEFGEGEAQVVLARAAHLPASAAVFVGKGVGVFDGERGLAQSADAVDGGDDADVSGRDEVLAQHPQIGGAADEVRVVRVHVAETFFGALAARDGLDNLAVELAHALLHGGFAQGFLALVMPGAQVEVLALAQFGDPRGALLLEILAVPARHFDEVNRRDAIEAVQMADFVFEVFDKLPFAILALEIRRERQASSRRDSRSP